MLTNVRQIFTIVYLAKKAVFLKVYSIDLSEFFFWAVHFYLVRCYFTLNVILLIFQFEFQ